jgi:CubicO group peptidase (beta-lactamase class C family)
MYLLPENIMEPKRYRKILIIFMISSFCVQIGFGQKGIKPDALNQLINESQKSHSDALVIWKDGKPYGEWYFGKTPTKIDAMSATKSVVNLAIGRLISEGKIISVDQHIFEFYPEWKQGRKKEITIRQILNHTSGIQNNENASVEIYPSPDFIKLALAAELSDDPGKSFSYNNKAVNLLAGIVYKASGKRMDLYIRDELFLPLGITDFSWRLDSLGNPQAMAGLQILPADFAKLGQLVLNKGKWNSKQLIAESWFDESFRPGQQYSPTCGLLWWLIPNQITYIIDDEQVNKLASKGIDNDFMNKFKLLKGIYRSENEVMVAVQKVFGDQWQQQVTSALKGLSITLTRKEYGETIGYYASGYLGQYLVIIPSTNLIVVRMIKDTSGYNQNTDGLTNIQNLVINLTK